MKTHVSILVLLFFIGNSAWAEEAHQKDCARAKTTDIEALFERWNDSLKSGNAKKVAANYLSDAVLLPTISNQVRLTDAERIDYFEHFLKMKPVGKINTRTIRIGCDKAIDVGTYTFTYSDNSQVSPRYTFTYAWDGKQWKISSHHSSVMPDSH